MLSVDLQKKYELLTDMIKEMGSVAIAFSGGVDSTLLLKVAHDALGEGAAAFTIRSVFTPEWESGESVDFCENEGIRQLIIDADVLSIDGIKNNPEDRCYLCKKTLFSLIKDAAAANGIDNVCDGTNTDDLGDYRPGMRAVKELGIRSPLKEAGLSKSEIRELSKELGLSTWRKPSFACLASRFAYGEPLSEEKLARVDAAEKYLRDKGIRQFRVRSEGRTARIEVEQGDIETIIGMRTDVVSHFKKLGYLFVSLDLEGYRTGSMNATGDTEKTVINENFE